MEQESLFHVTYKDALRDDVAAIGGAKKVGQRLFPGMDALAAGRALNDRLNDSRRERLPEEQERLIIREAKEVRGFSSALNYICDECGFERPKPVNPADKQAQLIREFNQSVKVLEQIAKQIPIQPIPSIQVVK